MDLVKFLTLAGSVHFVDMNLDPSRGSSIVWINVKVYPYRVHPFCGLIMFSILVRSVHFVDLRKRFTLIGFVYFVDLCRKFTLIGSVHFVDMNVDPSRGPSTLWIRILIPHWVRRLCGIM